MSGSESIASGRNEAPPVKRETGQSQQEQYQKGICMTTDKLVLLELQMQAIEAIANKKQNPSPKYQGDSQGMASRSFAGKKQEAIENLPLEPECLGHCKWLKQKMTQFLNELSPEQKNPGLAPNLKLDFLKCKARYEILTQQNHQLFTGAQIGVDQGAFQKFIKNLKQLQKFFEQTKFTDPFCTIKFTKFSGQQCLNVNEERYAKFKELLGQFLITGGDQHKSVVRALIESGFYNEISVNHPNSTVIQLFPYFFIRETSLRKIIIRGVKHLIGNQAIKFLAREIQEFYSTEVPFALKFKYTHSLVTALMCKGLENTRFISFPDSIYKIRGFTFAGKIYLNTYFLERNRKLLKAKKQAQVTKVFQAYLSMNLIRFLANYVIESLTGSFKYRQQLNETLSLIYRRKDWGSRFQKFCFGGLCKKATIKDYNQLSFQKGQLNDSFGDQQSQPQLFAELEQPGMQLSQKSMKRSGSSEFETRLARKVKKSAQSSNKESERQSSTKKRNRKIDPNFQPEGLNQGRQLRRRSEKRKRSQKRSDKKQKTSGKDL